MSVPVIMGTKPALMQFAHQLLIVSDQCHSHSKTIRSERRKCITKAQTIQNNHCWHTHFKWGFHCHKNVYCSLWKEYSWGHNYDIWCCINKISKSTLLIWIGNPSSQSMTEAYTEKKANPPFYRCIIFPPNPRLFNRSRSVDFEVVPYHLSLNESFSKQKINQ